MTDEKQGFADRFARWARMGNNGRDARDLEGEEMEGMGTQMQAEDFDGAQAEVEASTEGGASDAAGSAQLQAEVEQARGERDQLRDRLARLQAEFDNARKRELKSTLR